MKHFLAFLTLSIFEITTAQIGNAHDLWIETNSAFVRTNEVVNVAFKLGNCDEGRRDFRTKGLIDKDGIVAEAVSPSRKRVEITSRLVRSSNDPSGGYWTSVCSIEELGTNWFSQSLDQVIEHDGKEMRGIVTAKAFVVASETPEPNVRAKANQLLNLPVEFELQSSAFPSIEGKTPIRVRLFVDSKPTQGVTVSFIPQGINLEKAVDSDFEVVTDSNGIAEFLPQQANLYLISARHITVNDKPNGPMNTYYSTSLTLRVTNRPAIEANPKLRVKTIGE